jgi:hypothetical protein
MTADFAALLPRIERLLDRLETPAATSGLDWKKVRAARWAAQAGVLKPILHPQRVALRDLLEIDDQKRRVDANTRQFVAGRPANNVLLTGARGSGKSSLVKAIHAKYAPKGLRLIEVDKAGSGQPAGSVRPAGGDGSSLHHLHRRSQLRRARTRLRQPQGRARRLAGRAVGQRADLRHQQPPPPYA